MSTRPFLRRGPSGPLATDVGALVRVGYDIIAEEMEIEGGASFLPRNTALDPLQVTFPEFTAGNTLEVDFNLNGTWESETPDFADLNVTILVSLDGGTTFYALAPSAASARAEPGDDSIPLLRSLASIKLVDPMPVLNSGIPGTIPFTSPPIVRVAYQWDEGTLFVNGDAEEFTIPGGILKCTELSAASVFQGPLGQLATT